MTGQDTLKALHIKENRMRTPSLQWMNDALCAQVGTDVFFPDPNHNPRQAIATCQRCEVRMTCLDYALSMPFNPAGIWGGTTERERRDMRRAIA